MLTSRLTQRTLLSILAIIFFTWLLFRSTVACRYDENIIESVRHKQLLSAVAGFAAIKDYLIEFPLRNGNFGEMGRRVQLVGQYVATAEEVGGSVGEIVMDEIEELVLAMFPFVKRRTKEQKHTPVRSWRKGLLRKDARGIIIPCTKAQFAMTVHLISALREVLDSRLPIQVAYAGEEGLPQAHRDVLTRLDRRISVLDISIAFNVSIADPHDIQFLKPFALLASNLEEVLLVDPDTVFLQDPSIFFEYQGYRDTGTYLFRDPLVQRDIAAETLAWQQRQLSHHAPTPAMQRVLNGTASSPERQQAAGVMLFDKRRLNVTMALLHVAWQTAVRGPHTIAYGTRNSWWAALEVTGADYAFGRPHASIVGRTVEDGTVEGKQKVCSYARAHRDNNADDKLLWYDGGLFDTFEKGGLEYEIPKYWMENAEWALATDDSYMSCMRNGEVRVVNAQDVITIQRSIEAALRADIKYAHLVQDT